MKERGRRIDMDVDEDTKMDARRTSQKTGNAFDYGFEKHEV
jgi:hypothetical protein